MSISGMYPDFLMAIIPIVPNALIFLLPEVILMLKYKVLKMVPVVNAVEKLIL